MVVFFHLDNFLKEKKYMDGQSTHVFGVTVYAYLRQYSLLLFSAHA
jgi:hypothetical protein